MKKLMMLVSMISALGMGLLWADSSTTWTSQTPGPAPTPILKNSPNNYITPSRNRGHRRHKLRILPSISGMAAYTPTPTVRVSPSPTPTPWGQ